MPSGISDGNYHWLGDYEQCQRLKELVFLSVFYLLKLIIVSNTFIFI